MLLVEVINIKEISKKELKKIKKILDWMVFLGVIGIAMPLLYFAIQGKYDYLMQSLVNIGIFTFTISFTVLQFLKKYL